MYQVQHISGGFMATLIFQHTSEDFFFVTFHEVPNSNCSIVRTGGKFTIRRAKTISENKVNKTWPQKFINKFHVENKHTCQQQIQTKRSHLPLSPLPKSWHQKRDNLQPSTLPPLNPNLDSSRFSCKSRPRKIIYHPQFTKSCIFKYLSIVQTN